eukprot:5117700-Prymnesium_polylepis.1
MRAEMKQILHTNDVFFADTSVGHRAFDRFVQNSNKGPVHYMKDRVDHNSHVLVIKKRSTPRTRDVQVHAGSVAMMKLIPDRKVDQGSAPASSTEGTTNASAPMRRLASEPPVHARRDHSAKRAAVEMRAAKGVQGTNRVNYTSFCANFTSHEGYRHALRTVDLVAQTTDEIPKKTFPRDSAIMAKCCSAFVGDVP